MNFIAPLTILGFVFTVWFVAAGRAFAPEGYGLACKALGLLWVMGPPLWMAFEYYSYFPRHGNPEAGYEGLKSYHSILTRLWFGVVVVMVGLMIHAFR
jgi:hypothetical protein